MTEGRFPLSGESFSISGNVVDVVSGEVYPGTIHVAGGVIARIEKGAGGGVYITPGLVDSHVHVESSMLAPCEFARAAVARGTLAVVCDPHEIANVMGIAGIEYMMDQAGRTPLRFAFGVPSCVPASPFETSGAAIDADDVERLLAKKGVTHLAEVMNYPAVIARDEAVMAKIKAAQRVCKPIDGHAPGLSGEALKSYVSCGISTDHEVTSAREALERISLGMKVMIREGSAARSFSELHGLVERHGSMCMFCTDDIHPDDLVKGHMDRFVRRAVREGHDVLDVLACASIVPARHYGIPMGLLQEGDAADFLVVEDLQEFRVVKVYSGGCLVAQDGKSLMEHVDSPAMNVFRASSVSTQDVEVPARKGRISVIEASSGSLVTRRAYETPLVRKGAVISDAARDILKIVVVNRYRKQRPQVAFVRGFGLRAGAMATSVAHDSHNIVAVGVTDGDICRAVNAVVDRCGGLAIACGRELACLELPIAGLMSLSEAEDVADRYRGLRRMARELGSSMEDPFMTLSFMALLVIPELKISDRGLFDATAFTFTSLWSEA